jgi:recombination protein RecR
MDTNIPAPKSVIKLIEAFNRLPGIGPKSAQRLAYYIIRMPKEEARLLADSVWGVKQTIIFCSRCQNLTEIDPCVICSSSTRDHDTICLVEEPLDVLALERAGFYKGQYHVLHGLISPINGIGPDDLKIRDLLSRLESDHISEVIIALDPTLEGDATAMYIHRLLSPFGVTITNLARGLPVGGNLEYADDVTLSRAFHGRTEL